MLPLILGAVALGTVGYGVKNYLESDVNRAIAFDEKAADVFKGFISTVDKIEDSSIGYLNSLTKDDKTEQKSKKAIAKKQINKDDLQQSCNNLYKRKKDIVKYMQEHHLKEFAQDIKIKKDKVPQEIDMQEVIDCLNVSNELLTILCDNIDNGSANIVVESLTILETILNTRIIQKGKNNILASTVLYREKLKLQILEEDNKKV